MKTLPIGLRHRASTLVDESLVVPGLAAAFPAMADMPRVFATAYLVAFVEATCIEALQPYLDRGEGTVGTEIAISHCAATPVGRNVTAEVELIGAEGRKLRFRVHCREEDKTIGEGLHERALIDRQRFIIRCYPDAG